MKIYNSILVCCQLLTENCKSRPVCPDLFLVLSFLSALRRFPASICVSPHVTDSSIASCMKMYWS